jgi:cysteine sulfinate desulfinase/cysteine desulfurase-like protein
LTLSGHKFHGPKGVGVLYVRKGVELEPLVSGGHQERGLRAGTENTLGIVGLGTAADLALESLSDMDRVRCLRDQLEDNIRSLVPDVRVNGHPRDRLPNTLNITLPEVRGESMVLALDQQGFSVSSGSACRSGQPDPSYALLAMGLSEEDAHCSLRFSLGRGNTSEEVERLVRAIGDVLQSSGDTIRFVSCR